MSANMEKTKSMVCLYSLAIADLKIKSCLHLFARVGNSHQNCFEFVKIHEYFYGFKIILMLEI